MKEILVSIHYFINIRTNAMTLESYMRMDFLNQARMAEGPARLAS